MAENPYLPSNLQQIGMMLSALGMGFGRAGAQGRSPWAGIAPAAVMFGRQQARTRANALEMQQADEARKLREQQIGMQQQNLDLKKAAEQRRIGLGEQITSMLTGGTPGMGVPPAAPTMGPQDLSSIGEGIARVESGGNYQAKGPETGRGRALGKYQVMDFNVGPWTQEALGRPLTPEQFLASPEAQEAVFRHKMGEYVAKYGPEGARRAWFAGEGGMNNPNASDVNGMTVARYSAATAPQGGPAAPQATPQGIAALDPTVRATIAAVAQTDPEKAATMLAQAVSSQSKPDNEWVPLNLSDPRNAAMFPNLDPTKAYLRNRRNGDIKAVGGSGNQVTVNTAPRALSAILKERAEQFEGKTRPAAESAVSDQQTIYRARQLLDAGIFSGMGAEAQAALSRFGQALGIDVGADQQANTAAFSATIAQRVANVIKQFGSGTGLSNADREYALKMAGGDISQGEAGLRKILRIGEEANRNLIERYHSETKRLRKAPGFNELPDEYWEISEPPSSYEEWAKNNPLAPVAPLAAPAGPPPPPSGFTIVKPGGAADRATPSIPPPPDGFRIVQ